MRRARRETPLANSAWMSHGHRDGSGRRCREQGPGCGFRGTERQWGAERFRGDGGEGHTTVCHASATAVCTRDGGGTSTGRAPGKGHGVPRGEPPRLADSSQPARGLQTARACSPGGGSPTQGPPRRTRGAPAEAGAAGPSCGQEETKSQRSRFQCLNFVCFSYKNAFHFLPCLLLFMLEVRKSKCTI